MFANKNFNYLLLIGTVGAVSYFVDRRYNYPWGVYNPNLDPFKLKKDWTEYFYINS